MDHIFVHTEQMKSELLQDFGVPAENVTVIPFGINNAIPLDGIDDQPRRKDISGIQEREKTILFFGNIGPYKGLDHLIAAFEILNLEDAQYRLIIAGKQRSWRGDNM